MTKPEKAAVFFVAKLNEDELKDIRKKLSHYNELSDVHKELLLKQQRKAFLWWLLYSRIMNRLGIFEEYEHNYSRHREQYAPF